ncbi:hypothetical protein CVT25_004356 [Psilocybe cyanescens]|uniref:Uncharacterized protein n=1 Tax=Psilocybe cyanescens TaxID=93625 RepID=A0A409XQ51_PSICY|nr:hypothetical protein CVT25_004356 [Psilocybe cyanescens]
MSLTNNVNLNNSTPEPYEVAQLPSKIATPTKVNTAPQQGSTSPGDGKEVGTHGTSRTEQVPFKERVIGVAQLTGNQGLKEHGEKILEGVTTHEQDRGHP